MKSKTRETLRFSGLHLENWRNFAKIEADLQHRVFLVGPNASGKSNLLDVFSFLRDVVSAGGLEEAVRKRGGISRLRCLAARNPSDVIIDVTLAGDESPPIWRYALHLTQDKRLRPIIKREWVERDGSGILSRPDDLDMGDPERLTQTYLQQVNANREFRAVADFFSTVRYLHIVPQLVREPDRSVGRRNDPYGSDFLEQITRAGEKAQKARLRRVRDALRVAIPQLSELELYRDPRGTPHLRQKYEHWRPKGAWRSEVDFSDGTLRLMGLLWAALDGGGPLLLEEPELSLHPDLVRFIPQMFARLQSRSGRQVIVSTHSSELLRDDGIGLDEVLLMLPGPEGTTVRPAGALGEVEVLLKGGVSLAEAIIPYTRPERAHELSLLGD